MKRKIVEIDEAKCTGCGLCANACHEGAIAMVDGKAKLVKDDYCDGMGDCLPECPVGAIKSVEREAAAYDEKAVQERNMAKMQEKMKAGGMALHPDGHTPPLGGCPGKAMRTFNRTGGPGAPLLGHPLRGQPSVGGYVPAMADMEVGPPDFQYSIPQSQLAQWPCQIRLVPVKAPFFNGAKLLIAADCTAYAYANFHQEFMRGKVTIVGCQKLDPVDYTEKLTEILRENDIKSLTIVRMEVPCCGGLEMAAKKALQASGKFIPWQVVTISLDGRILDA